MRERDFEKKVVRWLKENGCVVFKMTPGPGVPPGTPDRLFLRGDKWGMLEIKASSSAKFQPLQKEFIEIYNNMSFCRVAYPENWDRVRGEIGDFLHD